MRPSTPPLFKHQKRDITFEVKNPIVFDTSDPGTGKTRTRLEAYAKLRASGTGCLLVLAPKSLLRSAWEADAQKYTPWLEVSVAYAENREAAFDKKADVYITNHDAAKWLAGRPAKFWQKFKGGALVIDESGAFKHHTSQRSRAVNKIKKHFVRRVCMNGTPNPNTVLDVWHQVFILDDGKRLGKSFFAFRNSVCTPEQVGPRAEMVKWTDREGAEEAVASLLADITIRNRFEDCVDIPANHQYEVPFFLTKKLLQYYQDMERDQLLLLKDGKIQAINAAAVVTKLLQIASGAVYDGEGDYKLLDTARYELVADLAEERQHSLVFFNWKHQRDELVKEFDKRGITYMIIDGTVSAKAREEAVRLYQAGFYRVGLLQPQSAAHGLTLTRASAAIWSSPTYNLEHFLQGSRRHYRAGQKEKTETISVIAQGTLEERVYQVCQTKGARMNNLLDMLKEAA